MDNIGQQARDRRIARFVRETYGFRGTWALHRAALGWDMLRAPVNLLLAPVFLIVRLCGLCAGMLGWNRVSTWLLSRRILLRTRISRVLERRIRALVSELGVDADDAAVDRALEAHAGVRGAVAEIVTMLVLLASGLILFRAATPGVVSLAGPVAALRARAEAVADFPLGRALGNLWYGIFPVALDPWQIVLTGLVLAALAALVTTFAGVLADPVQVATGTHRRRLTRLIDRLAAGEGEAGLEREHLAARLGDLSDMALTLWRSLKG